MKQIAIIIAFLIFISGYGQEAYITKGGVYTGQTFSTTSASSNAVLVNCYDTVKFIGCKFRGLLRGAGGSNMVVVDCTFDPVAPVGSEQYNRAVDVFEPQAFYMENCTVNSHTGGVRIDHRNQNTNSIIIRKNRFYNIDARNGRGEYNGRPNQRAAILIDGCVGIKGEVAYNYIYNAPDTSCIEDNINIRNSGGTSAKSFPVHHNYIDGAYSWPLHYNDIPSVSGITIETGDESAYNKVAQFIEIYSNKVVRTANGGINITSAHDINSHNNTVISSGRYPHNGQQSWAFWAGYAVWNGSSLDTSVYKNIVHKADTAGYVRPGSNRGGFDRNDWSTPETISANDIVSLPNPITKALEDRQLQLWKEDTAKAFGGIVAPVVIKPDTLASGIAVIGSSVSLSVGDSVSYAIDAYNSDSLSVSFKSGSVAYSSSASTFVRVVKDVDEKKFSLVALKVTPSVTITIKLINNAGTIVTRTVKVSVQVNNKDNAAGIRILKLN